jgi:hypothetical protein
MKLDFSQSQSRQDESRSVARSFQRCGQRSSWL